MDEHISVKIGTGGFDARYCVVYAIGQVVTLGAGHRSCRPIFVTDRRQRRQRRHRDIGEFIDWSFARYHDFVCGGTIEKLGVDSVAG